MATRKAALEITNCLDCPHHEQQRDPDPHDWFNDDDQKVVCKHSKRERIVASGERPYQLREACAVPKWCPLSKAPA